MDQHKLRLQNGRVDVVQIKGNLVTFDASLVAPWVFERAGGQYTPGCCSAIGRIKDGKLVAGVTYSDYNGASVVCGIAGEGSWANRGFLWLIFDYPFNQLGVRRITTFINPNNKVSQKFTLRLGFTLESTLKEAHPDGDMWVTRMFKHECKWIEE